MGRGQGEGQGSWGARKAVLTVALLCSCLAPAWGSPVEAELVIPPAETHVIGDVIPLFWRFKNTSAEPLAFMWEGCCRLNGRLSVTKLGENLQTLPPGQALAHMFAKAERLEPGKPRDFDTRLSDWVTLADSGAYQLQGRYVGVLPTQQPQVPRGLRLWRDAAVTPTNQVRVLSVRDYLAQRAGRAGRRQLTLDLAGPALLPPLKPSPFQLRITNRAPAEQTLAWPNQFQLWIVDGQGQRVTSGSTLVDGNYEEIRLSPGASVMREVLFSSEKLEGHKFGEYRVFVDLASAGESQPRVPSNPVATRWQLADADVRELVAQAAGGAKTGSRNPPLKLLRVYLAEVRPALASLPLDTLPTPAVALARQLALAACLKPLAPVPGHVDLAVRIGAAGDWSFAEARVEDCAVGSGGPAEQLAAILAVRRHLGWEIGIVIEPDERSTLGRVMAVAVELDQFKTQLAGVPQAVLPAAPGVTPARIAFHPGPPPAETVLRLSRMAGAIKYEWARAAAAFKPGELATAPFQELAGGPSLEALLAKGQLRTAQVLILADERLAFSELAAALQPLIRRGAQMDLSLTSAVGAP